MSDNKKIFRGKVWETQKNPVMLDITGALKKSICIAINGLSQRP